MLVGSYVLWVILAVALAVFSLICAGRILTKTGENGWKILIPFYGMYLFYRRTTDMGLLFWVQLVASALAALANQLSPYLALLIVVNIVLFQFLFYINLSVAFDHTTGFAAGLLLLFPVFIAILAFDPSAQINDQGNHVSAAASADSI